MTVRCVDCKFIYSDGIRDTRDWSKLLCKASVLYENFVTYEEFKMYNFCCNVNCDGNCTKFEKLGGTDETP